MQINVAVTDANNIVCQVVPPQTEVITIDRGVAGNGIVSIVPVTISTFQYLRITYTNGTVQDVGPLTSTAYTATAPITIVGNTISLATVPIASGGTDATTAAGAIQNLLPSYTGNANKRLGLNSTATGLEWVLDGGGTVTSIAASGGTTGLTFSGSPITTSGTLTLGGTLGVANGGTGATTAGDALTNLGAIGAITSTDGSVTITSTGTSRDLSVAVAAATNNVIAQVRNTTGATLAKGTVVYISGATGQVPTVSKAIATGDATSAQTLGMITTDLPNNSNGNVTIIGLITNIDTSAYTDGAQLYLSGTTAGAVTATKPYAPIHLVYVAVVEYAHPTQGKLFVKVQNGYELDEIHDVSIVSPVTGQTLVYNSTTDLWVNNTVSLTAGVNGTLPVANGGTGVTTSTGTGSVVLSTSPTLVTPLLGTPTSGNFSTGTFTWPTFNQNTTGTAAGLSATLAITSGGTGQTTANAAFNALAPSQTGNSGKYLTTDGSNTSWATNPLGTVTSVAATVPSFLSVSGSPITTSGTLAFGLSGTALPTTSGGTGLTSFTSGGVVYASSSSALATSANLSYSGTQFIVSNSGATTGPTVASYAITGNGNNNFAASFSAVGEAYAINTASAKYQYAQAGSILSISATSNGVNSGALIDFNAYNSTNGATGVFIGAVSGATGNGAASFVIGRRTAATNWAESLRVDTSGNVGIGTNSPAYRLDVRGTGYFATTSGTNQLTLGDSTNGTISALATSNSNLIFYADGSSESMRVNSTGLGIGTSSVSGKLTVANTYTNTSDATIVASSSIPGLNLRTPSTGRFSIFSSYNANNSTSFLVGTGTSNPSTVAMYIDHTTGNIGVGTTGPVTQLQVNSGSSFVGGFKSTVANGYIALQDSGTSGALTDGNVAIGAISNDLAFRSGGATRMRLDSAGNLGLGVTPSSWFSNRIAIQVGGNSVPVFATAVDGFDLMNNSYTGAGAADFYTSTGYAAKMRMGSTSGQFQWFTAPSGTAGTAITFSQRMTLTAAGLLGVGTTSPSQKIETDGRIRVTSNGTNGGDMAVDQGGLAFSSLSTTPIVFERNNFASESARFDGSGNFLVGGTGSLTGSSRKTILINSGAGELSILEFGVAGTLTGYLYSNTSQTQLVAAGARPLIFETNSSERARITSSGSLLVGATSAFNGELLQVSRAGTVSTTDFIYTSAPTALIQTPNNGVDNKAVLMLRAAFTDGSFSAGSISVKSATQYRGEMVLTYDADASGGFLAFNQFIPTSATTAERARFNPNGYLGIGTSNPNTKLDIRGTSNTAESTIQVVGNSVSTLLLGQNADGGVVRAQGGNNTLTFWTGGSADTGAGQSGSERARITSSGLSIGSTALAPSGGGLRVQGAINPISGIVSTNLIAGYVASNYSGTRYWLLHIMQTGAGVEQSAFNCMGDVHASSYTTWNLCNLWIRREYASVNVYAGITGVIKSAVTVSVVDITYSNVRYVAIKFAGGDPGIEANLVGYLMNQMYTNGTDASFINGTSGVTENAVIASY